MNIIFINNIKYINKLVRNKENLFIPLNNEISRFLEAKRLNYKKLEEYLTEEDLNKKTIQWIKDFPNQKISNNKNIKEYFTYKNVSLWWLAEFYLFSTGVFFPGYQDILLKFESIKRVIESEKTQKVIYIDDRSIDSKLIKKICKLYHTNCVRLKTKHLINKEEITDYLKRNGILAYKLFRNLLRKFCWNVLSLFDLRKRNNKNKILIFTESQWGEICENGKRVIGDIRFNNILKEIEKQGNLSVTVVDNPIGSPLRLEYFTKRINRFSKNPPLEAYIKISSLVSAIFDQRKIRKKYKKVKGKIQYIYEGVDFKELFKPKFDFFFEKYIYETILFFKGIKNAIKKENPIGLVVSSETNPPQRIAIALGHQKKIKSVAVQHGAVGYNSEIVNNKKDICHSEFSYSPFLPLPNKICVYGKFYKNFFLRYGGYNNQLIITGNPKYDCNIRKIDLLNRNKLKRKFGLNINKKVVLFFSKPYNDYEEGIGFLNGVYESLKNIKDIQIIVKIHPNEFDVGLHKKIISKKHMKNVLIFEKEDIFELGMCSDIVISCGSTVVMDMAVVRKPVVMFDPNKKDAYSKEYSKIKAGVLTYDSLQLKNTVESILKHKSIALKIIKNQEGFIKEYMYCLDNGASKRIVNIISDLTK